MRLPWFVYLVISLFIVQGCIWQDSVGHFVEAFGQHVVRYFGVNLGRLDVRVPQHPADHLDADALCQRVGRRERMAGHMIGYRLVDTDLCRNLFQHAIAVGDVGHGAARVVTRNLAACSGL